ncbi:SDR family oxidoreductase [Pseudomonas aeruginosa]
MRQPAASLGAARRRRRRRWTANRPRSCSGTCACPPTWISAAPWTPPNCWRHGTSCSPAPAGRWAPTCSPSRWPAARADLHCPVRAQNDAHALERLRQAARQHRIELAETDWRRVRAYAADLAEPGFGLPAETYRELAGSVDQVFHSASAVNFIQPYS